jgi:hypothetical protein
MEFCFDRHLMLFFVIRFRILALVKQYVVPDPGHRKQNAFELFADEKKTPQKW